MDIDQGGDKHKQCTGLKEKARTKEQPKVRSLRGFAFTFLAGMSGERIKGRLETMITSIKRNVKGEGWGFIFSQERDPWV